MTTYRFAITGLRHHDFANRLDELYDKAMGKRISQGQVNDIMTFNSYGLQYYSFRKGKIGFARTVPVSWITPIHTKRYNITI